MKLRSMSNISTKRPLQVPHHKQEQNNSCLPACVRMVMAFHGAEKSVMEIRRLLKTKLGGTNPLNVTHLREWNFEATVSFSNLDELQNHLFQEQPAIALPWSGELSYWDSAVYLDFLHAVVIIGYDAENILINDPAPSILKRLSLVSF